MKTIKLISGICLLVIATSAALLPRITAKTTWSKELKYQKSYVNHGIVAKNGTHFITAHTKGSKPTAGIKSLDNLSVSYSPNGLYNPSVRQANTWRYMNKSKLNSASEFVLKQFNNNLEEIKSVEIELNTDNSDRRLEKIIQVDQKIVLFYSLKDRKAKTASLYAETMNINTLERNNDIKTISSITVSHKKILKQVAFTFCLSEDASKIFILNNIPSKEDEENDAYQFSVYDSGINIVWNKNVSLPTLKSSYVNLDFKLTNDGDIFILGQKFGGDKNNSLIKGQINTSYEITSYKNNGTEKAVFPITTPKDKFITSLKFSQDNEKNIRVAGFYENPDKKALKKGEYKYSNYPQGTFHIKLNGTTGDEISSSTLDFKSNYKNLTYLKLNDFIISDNGSAFLIAEQERITTSTTTTSQGVSSSRTLHTNSGIVLAGISNEGTVNWSQYIQKNQNTENDEGYFNSYSYFVQENMITLFYNDHVKNISLSDQDGKVTKWRGKKRNTVLMMASVSTEGKLSRKLLLEPKQAEVMIRPYSSEQLNENEMLIYGEEGSKKYQFAKISLSQQ
jgi:hypothetical protein